MARGAHAQLWVGIAAGLVLAAAWPNAAVAQQRPGRTVSVLGRVVDSLAQPVPDATVRIESLTVMTRTDPLGRFRLNGVPDGPHLLQVRKIGFGPVDVIIRTPRDTSLAAVVLKEGAVQLRTMVTTAINAFGKPGRLAYTSRYDQFYERRAYSAGSGRFYTHEDIDRMGVTDIVDILKRIPHLRITESNGVATLQFPACGTGGIYMAVDGVRIWPLRQTGRATVLDEMGAAFKRSDSTTLDAGIDPLMQLRNLTANNIEAIESYPSSASLPVEAVGNACAALLFWTR